MADNHPVQMFWMVYSRNGRHPPKYEHNDRDEAKKEAERLARANPGLRFYILEATDTVVVQNPCKWEDLSIPF